MPSSGLIRHQTCKWHTGIYADNTLTHIKRHGGQGGPHAKVWEQPEQRLRGDGAVLRRHDKEASEAAKGGPKDRAVRRGSHVWRPIDCADFALGSKVP